MADKAADLLKLLDSIGKLGGKTVSAVADEKVKALRPAKELIQRWRPHFVDGYELKTPSGKINSTRCMWDAVMDGDTVGLSGPTGSGKTSIHFHLMDEANEATRVKNRAIWEENQKRLKDGAGEEDLEGYEPLPWKIEHLSCKEETRAAELEGDIDLVYDDAGNRRPVVRWGHVTRAWTQGRVLIAEEVDMPNPGVWAGTHQLFDREIEETDIFINGVQHIRRHPKFRALLTMNTLLKGENQEEYAGTQVQNSAWVNRIGYMVVVDYMKAEAETALLVNKYSLDKGLAMRMVAVANKSRDAYKERAKGVEAPITTRDLCAWSREILRAEKRDSITVASPNHWKDVVVPAAWPTFVCRQPDRATRDMYDTFLNLRAA